MGIPGLRAKQKVEIKGVGAKFSRVYYRQGIRHVIGEGAGVMSDETQGRRYEKEAPSVPKVEPPARASTNLHFGHQLQGVGYWRSEA